MEEKRFQPVFKILAFSGIRITEVVEFLTTYDETKLMESKGTINMREFKINSLKN